MVPTTIFSLDLGKRQKTKAKSLSFPAWRWPPCRAERAGLPITGTLFCEFTPRRMVGLRKEPLSATGDVVKCCCCNTFPLLSGQSHTPEAMPTWQHSSIMTVSSSSARVSLRKAPFFKGRAPRVGSPEDRDAVRGGDEGTDLDPWVSQKLLVTRARYPRPTDCVTVSHA